MVLVAFGKGRVGREDSRLPSNMRGHSKIHLQLFVSHTHTGLPEGIFQGVEKAPGAIFHGVRTGQWGPEAFPGPRLGAPGDTDFPVFSLVLFSPPRQGGALGGFQSSLWRSGRWLGGAGQTCGDPVPATVHASGAGAREAVGCAGLNVEKVALSASLELLGPCPGPAGGEGNSVGAKCGLSTPLQGLTLPDANCQFQILSLPLLTCVAMGISSHPCPVSSSINGDDGLPPSGCLWGSEGHLVPIGAAW